MSNDPIWKSNSCKFCFVFVFDMVSLTGEKRKIQSRTIVGKYKILKEIEKGESCAAVSRKHSIPKQTLSGWMNENQRYMMLWRKTLCLLKTKDERCKIR